MPAVVSMSPVMAAFAPEQNAALPLSGSRPRPPASRSAAPGSRKRKTATVRSSSSGGSTGRSSKGVPLMGLSRLTGTERTPSSRSSIARSTRSSIVSPMPMIPPLHTSSPARRAFRMTAHFSS